MVSPNVTSRRTCLPRPAKVRRRRAVSSKDWRNRSSRFFLAILDKREYDETDGTLRADS